METNMMMESNILTRPQYKHDFTPNKLYQYHKTHPENNSLAVIIFENELHRYDNMDEFLNACYCDLLNQNMIDTIHEIIMTPTSEDYQFIDEFLICLNAISKNMYNILELLIDNGFNIDHYFLKRTSLYRCTDLLTHAVEENNLEMCQFLLDQCPNPTFFSSSLSLLVLQSNTNTGRLSWKFEYRISKLSPSLNHIN